MRCHSPSLQVELRHGQVLSLDRARGWRVECEGGAVMLSGPAPVGDVELRRGEHYLVPSDQLLLLEAWRGCRVALSAPK